MNLRFLVAVICVVFFQTISFADDCSPVKPRLIDGASSVKDQGGSGICYAYVCANLLEAKLGRPVSPFDVAYNAKVSRGVKVRNTNDLKQEKIMTCLQAAAQRGLCCDEKFGQESRWDVMLDALENYKGKRPSTCPARSRTNQNSQHEKRGLSSLDGFDFTETFADICEPRSTYPNIHPEVVNGTSEQVLKKVDEVLSPATPVGVEVSGPVFDKPGHGLTLVGRYKEKNTCFYILKNSWGKRCSQKTADGLKNIGFLCTEDGHLIASRKAFLEVLDRAAYLK